MKFTSLLHFIYFYDRNILITCSLQHYQSSLEGKLIALALLISKFNAWHSVILFLFFASNLHTAMALIQRSNYRVWGLSFTRSKNKRWRDQIDLLTRSKVYCSFKISSSIPCMNEILTIHKWYAEFIFAMVHRIVVNNIHRKSVLLLMNRAREKFSQKSTRNWIKLWLVLLVFLFFCIS